MATFHNLKFEIVSGGKTLPMYEDPDAHENDDPLKCRKYIEAVTGATFKINVSPLPEYIRGQCDAVRVSVDLDGQNRTSKEMLKRPSLDGSNPGKTKVTFDGYSQYCQQTHQWTQGDLSFGGLEIKETSDSISDLNEIKDLGSIRIRVRQVKYKSRPQSVRTYTFHQIKEISEKMLKGKAITNTLSLINFTPCQPPYHRRYEHIQGPLGNVVVMEIHYRSKGALQILGCIPSTPSPEIEIKQDDNSASAADPEEEIQTLRARLALLEGQMNVKEENKNSHTRMKRERDIEDMEVKAESSRQKSRRLTHVEQIDLTSD